MISVIDIWVSILIIYVYFTSQITKKYSKLFFTRCYLALNTVSELPMAEERLQVCEQKFKASYGADMERVAALKGSSGNEAALMARLNLVQVAL